MSFKYINNKSSIVFLAYAFITTKKCQPFGWHSSYCIGGMGVSGVVFVAGFLLANKSE
jgi:hypothetical protein